MALKQKIREWLRFLIRTELASELRSCAEVQIGQRLLVESWKQRVSSSTPTSLRDAGFRVFSQFEEDGLLLFIFTMIGAKAKTFVDIGSADGISSNCANLALNFGWTGLFVDGDEESIRRGREYYARHPDSWAYPPKFLQAMVKCENINQLIRDAGCTGEVDLLSIDIDGNDYWIWDALQCVSPRVVIIETHIEFGLRSIVVPYDPDHVYPGKHPQYIGASPVAMEKLARAKGYRLVGANDYGFNMIYVRDDITHDTLPAVSVESVLAHPRNAERLRLFDEISDWKYIEV